MFGRIWDQAALPRPVAGQQPRPYDFRHHFAYANIQRWMKQGNDVAAMLPYLSRYMGHATFDSTYYYVHTSPDFIDSLRRDHPAEPVTAAGGRVPMRRDPKTGAPDFFSFARDYLHAYLPKTRGLSPKTIEAYRISLECFLSYLAETEHIERDRVSFDHFDRQHLKGWMTWMTDQRHYATEDRHVAPERRQSVPGLRIRRRPHPRRAQPGRQGPQGPGHARGSRSSTSPSPKHGRSLPRSPARRRNPAGTGCCSSCSTTPPHASVRSPA